jgi:hypothetical protein
LHVAGCNVCVLYLLGDDKLDDRRLWCVTILCVLELRLVHARLLCTGKERDHPERFKLGSERRTAVARRGLLGDDELDDRRLWCVSVLCVLELHLVHARVPRTANERGQLERLELGPER